MSGINKPKKRKDEKEWNRKAVSFRFTTHVINRSRAFEWHRHLGEPQKAKELDENVVRVLAHEEDQVPPVVLLNCRTHEVILVDAKLSHLVPVHPSQNVLNGQLVNVDIIVGPSCNVAPLVVDSENLQVGAILFVFVQSNHLDQRPHLEVLLGEL